MKDSVCLWAAAASLLLMSGIAGAQTASNVVCTGCVGTADLGNNSVTTQKIADGTIKAADIANQAVNSAKIKNGSVAVVDLATELQEFLGASLAQVTFTGAENAAVGVAGADCAEDKIAVSASCACDDENGTRNFGVLFVCASDGIGAVSGCFVDGATFDPQLPQPLALVLATCMGAESLDGSPWLPTSNGLAAGEPSSMKSKATGADHAQWMKSQRDKYESSLREAQDRLARHNARQYR